MKILIRADGGQRIGMGHIMRMLVLADKLKDFAGVIFACRKDEEFCAGAAHIEACGYKALRIDGSRLVEELAGIGGDCLITDSYDVDEDYFDRTREIFRLTGYMDDLNKCRINADFIINQNIYAEAMEYGASKAVRIFKGAGYVLLRDEFVKLPEWNIRHDLQDVMITLGGADPQNLTENIALKLAGAFPEMRFHIAIGPSFVYKDCLEKIAGGNILFYHNPRMSELMQKCDAAVSACGGTIYELCACGTPIIGVVTADNQIMAASVMNAMGVIKYAESPEMVVQHLRTIDYGTRIKMSETGRNLVDGYGGARLAEEIRKLLQSRTRHS